MKKLLELGTSVGSVDIVKYAREKGVYTIVADYLPPERSAAKRIADEHVLISTGDVDKLIEFAGENNVDAAFAGVSEFNIERARMINDALGVPFYYTPAQWDMFMKKDQFRSLCEKYHVDTPKTFYSGDRSGLSEAVTGSIEYPVIIKPVDNGANVGITICRSSANLQEAVETAFSASDSGRIIIEQFVSGPEISMTYVIQDHCCRLACMGTKYAYKTDNGLQALAHGYVYPSPCTAEYLEKADAAVVDMILGSGLNNSTIFFQGIYDNHRFYIFESGLRLEGTATFRITESVNGQSFMKFMVDNILQDETTYDVRKEDPLFGGKKCFIFSLIAREGTITDIIGTERVKEDSNIFAFEQRYYVGGRIKSDGTLKQIVFRFAIKNDDIEEVIRTINGIKKNIVVLDENGEDMLIKSFDPEILKE